ncbi:TPA: HORMA domain containing protein [Stenotrophomonas maltophilia]|uniref:HORMA domain containing protein n=1 Tax=Stenotrophomonas maltophilia TaxID=40324 RepID=UPI0015DE588C|nr:HORMA domain containing protein [Stenotrophomonas maltophilia]MBA0230955.1 HORMA domain containing protein [Stenotrophomonas maltophilia]
MTTVVVNTYTHSVVYVADNILRSLKDIIRLSGLDPAAFVGDWETNHRAIKTWLGSQHLRGVWLEIYNPATNALIVRWDIEISYAWSSEDGSFWTDTEQLRYAILKAGLSPASARYSLLLDTKPGRPDVLGWGTGHERSTLGMVRQSLGSTIEHSGLGGRTSYLRNST